MPDPAASLPVVYQTLARQARTYGDVDPQTLAILDAAAANPTQAPPGYAQAVQRITQQHPEFHQSIPMSWWEKAIGFGGPAALTAAPLLAGLAGGSAPAAASSGGLLPSTSTIGMTALPAGSAGGSIAGGISAGGAAIPGGVAAASAAPGWLGSLLSKGNLINAGLNLAGNLVASHQVNKAVAAQQQAAQQQLALQKQMYDTTRGDLAPYRTLGAGAASSLGYLLGLPGAK